MGKAVVARRKGRLRRIGSIRSRALIGFFTLSVATLMLVGKLKGGQVPAEAEKVHWTAQWIWATPDGLEPNTHAFFRKNFTLNAIPKGPVRLDISAETHYTLYVNGAKVGFGPPVSDPHYHYFDTRDIQPYLRTGPNVIAAHVYSLAADTEDTAKERGLFILEGSIPQAGKNLVLDTNRDWEFLLPEEWARAAPRQSWVLHFVEIADLRKEPVGWTGLEYDDSGWKPAVEAGRPPSGISAPGGTRSRRD